MGRAGSAGEALDWARKQRLSAGDELSYLREFEHNTLARVLLAGATGEPAGHAAREVVELLRRLTLRTHTTNIYSKPGVSSRRSAVHRAEELGLL